jgi:hypothetical protein
MEHEEGPRPARRGPQKVTSFPCEEDKDVNQIAQSQPKLQFADPATAAELTGGKRRSPNQWMGHCPLHDDRTPSLSIRWNRKRDGTMIHCFACCPVMGKKPFEKAIFAWFRQRGWWLSSHLPEAPKPKRSRADGSASVRRSVAFGVCTSSEHAMYEMIAAGEDPTYDDFEAAGIRHAAISPGIRVMEALGLIEADRKPFNVRRGQYEANSYRTTGRVGVWRGGVRPGISVFRLFRLAVP